MLWIAGHSGPETAEDSRTHFGIYEPGVTQLFPEGKVIDLHPWEYNEVPVVLARGPCRSDIPIIALHLDPTAVEFPDREALGMPSATSKRRAAPMCCAGSWTTSPRWAPCSYRARPRRPTWSSCSPILTILA